MSHVIGSIVSVAQHRNVAYPEINLQMIKIYHLARTCAVFTVLCCAKSCCAPLSSGLRYIAYYSLPARLLCQAVICRAVLGLSLIHI